MALDKSIIGKEGKPFSFPVDWSKVREYARAIHEDDAAYFDEEHARKEYGGIPVPPTFIYTSTFWQTEENQPPRPPFDLPRVLNGEQEIEYFKPIYVGDVLTGVSRVVDLFEKEGSRGGTMKFCVTETEYRNQKGEKVAVARGTSIETGRVVGRS